ncbi:hypothetical protein APS56_13240 [Pseudalgibacter alginicilyticus]|uniref:Uncharacterized protein n=1 Tax=Pseudalgibacter alginicilyticus TaxID=1736674 RepID=A0A0P0D7D8_9FLAO|nr:hypothetical protein [Pseudalgibacter alginicilyticus]ALJ06036.1 hypothetical protein APS56_13240 [Pseudalgibacter alginicilyticus]
MSKLYKSDKVRFIVGAILIIVIYSCYYIFFEENTQANLLPRKTQHVIKFLTTIVVYLIGTKHLGKLKDLWMSSIWHLIHISGLCIITLIGLYDWFIMETSLNVKVFVSSIQETLISPVLYLAMGLLNKSLKKST